MKVANEIFEWLIQSGAIAWLFYFGIAIAKPWVDGKIKHAKTAQQREAWTLLEQVAMTTVNSLVSNNDLTGEQKFNQAVQAVISALDRQGYAITDETAKLAVQAAYEKSPLTSSDQTTSTVTVGPEGVTTTIKPADGTATAIDPKEAK